MAKQRPSTDNWNGLPCPKCVNRSFVTDSRPHHGGIKRRRQCVVCNHRFTTLEQVSNILTPDGRFTSQRLPTVENMDAALVDNIKALREAYNGVVRTLRKLRMKEF